MKTVFLAIALAFIGLPSIAQNAAIPNAIDSDSTFSPKDHITQIPLENCYRIDTCEEKRFAIVLKDAKCGDTFQFMRQGYYMAVSTFDKSAPVFNEVVGLKDSFNNKTKKEKRRQLFYEKR